MRFPGRRKRTHYFPVEQKNRPSFDIGISLKEQVYILGVDQLLIDIEINADEAFLEKYGLEKGQSQLIYDDVAEKIYRESKEKGYVVGEFAGGAIGNTLHNYSVLSDDRSVALGVISKQIEVGDYAYNYICNTCSQVDFSFLQPVDGPIGRAFCFITPDGERTFGISKGNMNELNAEFIPESVIRESSAVLVSAFLLRDESAPLFQSVMKTIHTAKKYDVPIVLSLGTSSLVKEKKDFLTEFIKNHVTVLAMNLQEATALTGQSDPLLAGQVALGLSDLNLITDGPRGLYLCGYVDSRNARETDQQIHSKSIPEYNRYEYSRPMRFEECDDPVTIFSHINPYMGGPGNITNTNGAGDAALSALLHDMASNAHHRSRVPNSPKHGDKHLTYSSLAQISKYCNRVSYEVLIQNSPRLSRGLPEHEESLESGYWER
ncbi:MAG: inosine/guanosine kinase [Bacteriovoracaceae bacterium]|mgnify:CR=1 FL=1|jgi:inosine kinase|nr:inosine/guanosine kinase [Bacteriovoracaceae bacterium]